MRAYERFLNYVPVWTTSDETSDTVPSADRELVLARMLVEEMKGLEIADARVDDKGYVYGHIPATPGCAYGHCGRCIRGKYKATDH